MKPEDFILNSDYTSLSTKAESTTTVTFGGGTLNGLDNASQSVDITVPEVEEAAFQYMLSANGSKWFPTSILTLDYGSSFIADLMVSRVSSNKIRVYLLIANKTNSSESYPSKQVWIKESAIVSPDMK